MQEEHTKFMSHVRTIPNSPGLSFDIVSQLKILLSNSAVFPAPEQSDSHLTSQGADVR